MDDLSLSSKSLASIMESVLEKGANFRFSAKGSSMSPFIRNGDILTFEPCDAEKVQSGDVVAFRNLISGKLVVHRVVYSKGDMVLVKGDNLRYPDGYISKSEVIGRVVTVERKSIEIWYGGRFIAFLSFFRLLNYILLPLFRKIRKIFRGVFHE